MRALPSDPRTPVLVGVGTALADAEAVELMVLAAEAAGADADAPALLRAAQRIAVPRGTWSYTDPGRIVAERIGAAAARTHLVDLGIPQQTLINEALSAILRGDLDVVLVVGAEAKARAARAAKRSTAANAAGIVNIVRRTAPEPGGAPEIDQGGAVPDVHQVPEGEIIAWPEIEAGLIAPVEQYALIESALRAAERTPVMQHRRDVAELWARFNGVAQTNPEAAFPAPMNAAAIADLGPSHRPLAFPYGKWHASQWTVDQGAALLLCSVEAAERFGVPRDRWVFPVVGVESSHALPLTKRRTLHEWPAMRVLGRTAVERIGRPLADCEHAEVYSCFPAAVRVQQRELGLPVDGAPTITGGMTFAGGPFNSFVLHATAAMARRLREQPGLGLVTTVSGLLTKPGLAVWASTPDGRAPRVGDLKSEAEEATDTVDVVSNHDSQATLAACTVTYEGSDPKELIAILDTEDQRRVIAKSAEPSLIADATTTELVGTTFTIEGNLIIDRSSRSADSRGSSRPSPSQRNGTP
ncbi:MAG: acetyl-CoA C-acetyltransferase [Acidimicrobiaceae bacterium]